MQACGFPRREFYDSYFDYAQAFLNDDANNYYLKILEKEVDGLYVQDIIRGGILNNDPRIPRNIS